MSDYVHGYSAEEASRLGDQASTLAELLHADTRYPPGSRVLEAGCGVGAQTVILAVGSPQATITSIDVSKASLAEAERRVQAAGATNVTFRQADVYDLAFPADHFDHAFVCFVLEHLHDVDGALAAVARVLRPGGSITVIEGDHGSVHFHPDGEAARRAVDCLVELQRRAGGDALVGRRLHSVLARAGFHDVRTSARTVHADATRPALVDGFTRRTFIAMVEGVGGQAVAEGLIDEASWDAGLRDLRRTAEDDGSFSYTFYKAIASKVTASVS